ncbi:hypothetical protein CAEBREN_11859 [Caenorhabditis brenneri]|uniref:Uncharacterized protein n=1 Tax=Caenorhabditis brenneri TaxID=135651 RepID=G0MX83_CAEBE|nr:hypothetical protein CAEBREN_11859 [Caenorhabditis brenneri]
MQPSTLKPNFANTMSERVDIYPPLNQPLAQETLIAPFSNDALIKLLELSRSWKHLSRFSPALYANYQAMKEEIRHIDPNLPAQAMVQYLNSIPINEQIVREENGINIIRREEADPRTRRWNRPLRVLVTQFLVFSSITRPSRGVFQLWIDREGEWKKEEIPSQPTDRSSLRIQVWAGKLPNPRLHAQQVLVRVPWLAEQLGEEQFTNWFIENARGATQIDLTPGVRRTRRCQLCSSFVLGYPISNHHWSKCIFGRLSQIPRLQWVSINSRAFCSRCGTWSVSHIADECREHHCGYCGAVDHQSFQELCQHPGNSIDENEQNRIALEALGSHYETCQRLIQAGELAYRCQSDHPSEETYIVLQKLRSRNYPDLIGWCRNVDNLTHFPIFETEQYHMRTEFEGLASPEISSARVTSTLVFDPQDLDKIALYGMAIDQYRFQEFMIHSRRGNDNILVLDGNNGERARLRNQPIFRAPAVPLLRAQAPVAQIRGVAALIIQPEGERVGHQVLQEVSGSIEMVNESRDRVIQGANGQDEIQNVAEQPLDERPSTPTSGKRSPIASPELSADGWTLDTDEEPDTYMSPEAIDSVQTEVKSEENLKKQDEPSETKDDQPELQMEKSNFKRATSLWFQFNSLDVMAEPEELRRERNFVDRMLNRCIVHKATGKVLTDRETLHTIANRPVPHHDSGIETRICFLLYSLTGEEPSVNFQAVDYPVNELQEYIVYLQGAHRLLEDIASSKRTLEIRVSSCGKAIKGSPQHNLLLIPDLELFHELGPNAIFASAETIWCVECDAIESTTCECHRFP